MLLERYRSATIAYYYRTLPGTDRSEEGRIGFVLSFPVLATGRFCVVLLCLG